MKRKGFTLVELLIVIAIIGVLAAMMTLSSGDATLSAKAASIANGFKVLRSGFTLYKTDKGDNATETDFNNNSDDYLGPEVKMLKKFTVTSSDAGSKWTATYTFDSANDPVLAKFTTYSSDMGMTGTATTAVMRIY